MKAKRCFDVVVALALLLPALPVMAVVAFAVLVGSGRPVLHRAERVGLQGRPFVMYKFRTMAVAPAAAAVTGPDDPRITRVGRFLRGARLDELPQLLNVLRGDMSLVGPRPEDPRFVASYTDEQREVLSVRPGVTSPTAIAYRDEAALLPDDPVLRDAYYAEVLLPAKLALDLDYVRNRSLRRDLRILAETMRAMLRHGDGEAPVDGGRRVLMLGELDGFANGVRMRHVATYLEQRGIEVTLFDTGRLSRASTRPGSVASRLPRPTPRRSALYLVEAWGRLVGRVPATRRALSYSQILAELRLRRHILATVIDASRYDLVVCETPHDAWYVASLVGVPTWYDCPTPWADELRDEGRLTPRQHADLRRREREVFDNVDFLSFHWHSYAGYVRDEYGVRREIRRIDWGADESARAAQPAQPPRVVYLGSLSSRFIDLPLLARLCRRYPHVDVYGAPAPDPSLGLPYRGYATPEVLADYQLGLITCTRDGLRRRGFSAKHLEYLAAGLPVLLPRWRENELDGTVAYDEDDFADVVADAASRWQELSDAACRQASRLRWEQTLGGIDDILAELPVRA